MGILCPTIFLIVFCISSTIATSQVSVYPPGLYRSHIGGEATFTCLSLIRGVIRNEWLVTLENNTNVDHKLEENIVDEFSHIGNGLGTLKFSNLIREYNMTRIRCIAVFKSGPDLVASDATLLLLQGLLSAVNSPNPIVNDSTLSLTWTAPFSQDITDIDPDIEGYCIDVINSTSDINIHTECGIQETRFSYPIPPRSWCDIFIVIVTPVNVVGNGTMTALTFYTHPIASLVDVLIEPSSDDVMSDPTDSDVVLIMSSPVCTSTMTLEDLDAGTSKSLGNADVKISENNITFSAKVNRHYNISGRAVNSKGSSSFIIELSTHDIASATVTQSSGGGSIEISTEYTDISDARGALFRLLFINNLEEVDFSKSILLPLDRTMSTSYILAFDPYPGQYKVFVYDIESGGTLASGIGYPAISNEFVKTGNGQGQTHHPTIECGISTGSYSTIVVECTFPGGTTSAGFQVIAQQSDSSKVHKLHTNHTLDHSTPVTITVEERGMYQVNVLGISEGDGLVDSRVEYTGQVMVDEEPETIANPTIATPTTLGKETKNNLVSQRVIIVVSSVLGVIVIIIIVAVTCVICMCKKKRWLNKKSSQMHVQEETDILQESQENPRAHSFNSSVKTELDTSYNIIGETDRLISVRSRLETKNDTQRCYNAVDSNKEMEAGEKPTESIETLEVKPGNDKQAPLKVNDNFEPRIAEEVGYSLEQRTSTPEPPHSHDISEVDMEQGISPIPDFAVTETDTKDNVNTSPTTITEADEHDDTLPIHYVTSMEAMSAVPKKQFIAVPPPPKSRRPSVTRVNSGFIREVEETSQNEHVESCHQTVNAHEEKGSAKGHSRHNPSQVTTRESDLKGHSEDRTDNLPRSEALFISQSSNSMPVDGDPMQLTSNYTEDNSEMVMVSTNSHQKSDRKSVKFMIGASDESSL